MRTAHIALLPGALTAYLGFSGGGYFPPATGVACVVLALALVLRVTLAERLDGYGLGAALATAALALFGVWALLSSTWSDAPGRAVVEFDRAMLYALALALVASLPRTAETVRMLLLGLTAGAAAVCVAGLATRVLPDVFPVELTTLPQRLSYPMSYWNALGLMAVLAIVGCTHLACSVREHPALRIAGAALLPLLATALYFTFSRASIAVAALAVPAYLVLARPRGTPAGLIAALPTVTFALVAAYDADLLAKSDPTSPAATDQGHDLVLILVACVVVAAGLRAAPIALGLDRRAAAIHVSAPVRRGLAAGLAVAVVVALAGSWAAFDLGDRLERQYERFKEGDTLETGDDARRRLAEVGNNGRLDHWDEAVDAWHADELKGTGAGTYEITWAANRPSEFTVRDGHSLYLETLSELGWIGVLLLGSCFAAILIGLGMRLRGPDRAIWGALGVGALAWFIHAGQDWDWELPAVTLWTITAGGLALARADSAASLPRIGRVVVALLILTLAVTPVLAAISHSRLNDSVAAFQRGDCNGAIDDALASTSALSARAEPYAILAFCDTRLGQHELARRMMENAIDRDPDNWEFHYGLGLVEAAAGRDPRGHIARAKELNPLEGMILDAEEAFATNNPEKWKRRALEARLPIY